MPTAPLPDIQACVFDAYGTLFDVNSAAEGARGLDLAALPDLLERRD